MSEAKVKAIVLGGVDYKEKDKLITLFTLEQGIVTVVFRGVKNANAKLKSAKEMFSFGDFIFAEGKFNTVISADIIDSFFDLTKDIKKYYTACALLDIVKTTIPEKEANPKVFLALLKSLKALTEGVNYYYVINKFLIEIFESLGYKFSLNACNNCGNPFFNHIYMNLNYGDITCSACKMGSYVELTKSTYSTLRLFAITDFEKLQTLKLSEDTIKTAYNVLSLNYTSRFNKKLVIL